MKEQYARKGAGREKSEGEIVGRRKRK